MYEHEPGGSVSCWAHGMALIVSLDRGAIKLDLGDFRSVVLAGNEVQAPEDGGMVIAKHIHNRWISAQRQPDAFMTLNIAGPLCIAAWDGRESKLGPYLAFSMTDGILYVDQRVFGMWDSQNMDWYVKDAGAHCKRFRVSFHATD